MLPLAASSATAESSRPSRVAVETHTWLSMTIGDDHPRPWMAVFQRTLLSSLQVSGSRVLPLVPDPSGPRNCGHCAPAGIHVAQSALSRTASRFPVDMLISKQELAARARPASFYPLP